ncbi:MAG: malto-oligosyltrehalose trehalohydrolase [Chloroflexi bacterium]|nr:malto-oligosyltrehalose trehalohydrolase [Chloroflexota bacterium]
MAVTLGASYLGDNRCRFLVWAPFSKDVAVHIKSPREQRQPLQKDDKGYHYAILENVTPGSLYSYRLENGRELPDPASRSQPEGVHGPSQVISNDFAWTDTCWTGIPLRDYIIYELHVGTYAPEGTFDGVIPYLDELKGLGISAVELMPVAQFPGARNWGYDGVYPFAVQASYGGPAGLKRLVNACHARGMAVVLDVVYNHLGPEGNYLGQYGPYFTDRYRTPWGPALNFDGPYSDEVRRFFIENALYWSTDFHIDALRLDALHAILDTSPRPFLQELAASVGEWRERLGRRFYLIGESDADDRRLIASPESGGYGLDAQWNDDFHHCLHTLLTHEDAGYYRDFGRVHHLAKAFREGFVYSGQYSAYRRKRHGSSSRDIPAERFVVFAQNHDQVGNRMLGERLGQLVSFEGLKLAAAVVLLSPFVPLIFMGEEFGETAPFQYFTSHSDPALIEAVRRGRREEFTAFRWQGEPPDPQDEATFLRCKINHALRETSHHKILSEFYRELIRLRRETPALSALSKETLEVLSYEKAKVLYLRRWTEDSEAVIVYAFSGAMVSVTLPVPEGRWQKRLDSTDKWWLGGGSRLPEELSCDGETDLELEPQSVQLLIRTEEA